MLTSLQSVLSTVCQWSVSYLGSMIYEKYVLPKGSTYFVDIVDDQFVTFHERPNRSEEAILRRSAGGGL